MLRSALAGCIGVDQAIAKKLEVGDRTTCAKSAVAREMGVSPETVRKYRQACEAVRRAGKAKPRPVTEAERCAMLPQTAFDALLTEADHE